MINQNRPNQKSYTTPNDSMNEKKEKEFIEKVVQIDRVSRTVKGGTRIRFRVLVVIGDKKGRVGYGIGKSGEIVDAINKAVTIAKKSLINVPIVNDTIPHLIDYKEGSAHIKLMPARQGTSIVAGGAVRAVTELAGIKNILTKIYGTANKVSNVKATINALKLFKPINVEKK